MVQLLSALSSVRLYIPKDLKPLDNRQLMLKSIQVRPRRPFLTRNAEPRSAERAAPPPQEVQKRFPDGIPLLDPVDDMGIKDSALKKIIQKVEAFEHRMYSHPLHSDPNLESVYALCEKKALVRNRNGSVCGRITGQEDTTLTTVTLQRRRPKIKIQRRTEGLFFKPLLPAL